VKIIGETSTSPECEKGFERQQDEHKSDNGNVNDERMEIKDVLEGV